MDPENLLQVLAALRRVKDAGGPTEPVRSLPRPPVMSDTPTDRLHRPAVPPATDAEPLSLNFSQLLNRLRPNVPGVPDFEDPDSIMGGPDQAAVALGTLSRNRKFLHGSPYKFKNIEPGVGPYWIPSTAHVAENYEGTRAAWGPGGYIYQVEANPDAKVALAEDLTNLKHKDTQALMDAAEYMRNRGIPSGHQRGPDGDYLEWRDNKYADFQTDPDVLGANPGALWQSTTGPIMREAGIDAISYPWAQGSRALAFAKPERDLTTLRRVKVPDVLKDFVDPTPGYVMKDGPRDTLMKQLNAMVMERLLKSRR